MDHNEALFLPKFKFDRIRFFQLEFRSNVRRQTTPKRTHQFTFQKVGSKKNPIEMTETVKNQMIALTSLSAVIIQSAIQDAKVMDAIIPIVKTIQDVLVKDLKSIVS